MSGDGAVGGLGLHNVVAIDTDGGHETEGTEALSDDVGLDVTIVVLAGPDEATATLDSLGNNIINKTMLVVEASSLHGIKVLLAVEALESVNEESIVLLKDGVLGGKFKGEASVEGVAEASVGEVLDRLVSVEHAHVDASVDVSNVLRDGIGTTLGSESDVDAAGLGHNVVLAAVLVTESVSTNNNGLNPAWDATRNVGDNNGLAEHSAVKDVSNGTVGALPHLLEVELLDSILVRGDGGALDGDLVLKGGVGGIDSDLVIGGVTRGDG